MKNLTELLSDYKKIPPNCGENSQDGTKNTYYGDYSTNKSSMQEENSITDITINALDIQSREVPWLIENFLIRGGLNSLQGLPDSGKSWLSLNIVATVASGGVFPDNNGNLQKVEQGKVLYANFDDPLDFVVKPRLESFSLTQEDMQNITFVTSDSGVTFNDTRLSAVFEQYKPNLAVFDTLQHFIGTADMHRANEVNNAIIGLKQLAEKHNTCVLIIQHISKQASNGNGGSSVNWGLGSVAINGLFRSVWTIGRLKREEDSPYRKALLPSKTNLLSITPPARVFDLDPRRGFVWVGVDETVTTSDLIKGDNTKGENKTDRLNEAIQLLHEVLQDGAVKSNELTEFAKSEGISERTLNRAKKQLGVRSYQQNREWFTALR